MSEEKEEFGNKLGECGIKERNAEKQIVVDFAKRMEMVVVNTYCKKTTTYE